MAHTTAQAAASPGTIKLAGAEYRMAPLTDADYGEYEEWMQGRAMEIASKRSEGLPQNDRKVILERSYDTAAKLTMGSPEALPIMVSREGATRLVWMGVRREHADMSLDRVSELLKDPQTLADAMERFEHVNTAPTTQKKRTRRKT